MDSRVKNAVVQDVSQTQGGVCSGRRIIVTHNDYQEYCISHFRLAEYRIPISIYLLGTEQSALSTVINQEIEIAIPCETEGKLAPGILA